MSEITLGAKFGLKNTSYVYQVFDITGSSKNVPNADGRVIYLRVASKLGWINSAQTIITITERKFWDFFTDTFGK